jgi:hypothetical protein
VSDPIFDVEGIVTVTPAETLIVGVEEVMAVAPTYPVITREFGVDKSAENKPVAAPELFVEEAKLTVVTPSLGSVAFTLSQAV